MDKRTDWTGLAFRNFLPADELLVFSLEEIAQSFSAWEKCCWWLIKTCTKQFNASLKAIKTSYKDNYDERRWLKQMQGMQKKKKKNSSKSTKPFWQRAEKSIMGRMAGGKKRGVTFKKRFYMLKERWERY